MRVKGNKIQLEGEDFCNEEFYGIMKRVIEDMRKENRDPNWAGKGRISEQKEARDIAIRLYTAKINTRRRIAEAEAKYGQLPQHQLN